jgi:hypothetical protein
VGLTSGKLLVGSLRGIQRLLAEGGHDGIQAWVQVFGSIQDGSGDLHRRYSLPTNLRGDIAQRSKQ